MKNQEKLQMNEIILGPTPTQNAIVGLKSIFVLQVIKDCMLAWYFWFLLFFIFLV